MGRAQANPRSSKLAEDQALELERLTGLISRQADKGVRPAEIRISSDRLPFAVQDHQDYPVVVRLQAGGQAVEFVTIMAVRTLPPDPEWSPGDLHLHTLYVAGRDYIYTSPIFIKGN